MPNPLTLLGDSLKALATSPHLTFSPTPSGYAPASSWLGAFPSGAKKDYGALVGDPLQNYVIAAAVNAVALALPDAPPYLENLSDGRWVRVDVHPVLDFLRQPHSDLDDADVWSLTSLYRLTRGEAFWIIHLSDAGMPTEAVPYDPRRVRVIGTRDELISGYEVTTEDGRTIPFPKQQVLHFRHLPDPNNPRRGWTPLSTGARHLVGSNAASTYHTALLLNGAVSSWLISMRDAGQGNVTPEQFQTFIDAMRRKYSGTTESAGGIDGLSIPLEIQRMAYSPDEMAIDKLVDYYEQTLCSLTGVSKKLLDLGSDATYLNLREAITDFWERRLVPMRNKDARALTTQLLPLFGLSPTQWRLAFDFSNVPALQENQDALFTRWRELYRAGGCDLFTLQAKIGLPTVPETYKERFFNTPPPQDKEERPPDTLEAKAVWVESEHPRSKDGRFGHSSGTISRMTGQSSDSEPADYPDIELDALRQKAFDHLTKNEGDNFFRLPLKHVLDKMPDTAIHAILQNVKSTNFFHTPEEIAAHLNEPHDPDRATFGYYNHETGELVMDGDHAGGDRHLVYGHEMGHVLDPNQVHSSSTDWSVAWAKELSRGNLGPTARHNESEGFAEFASLCYSGEMTQPEIKMVFPKCFEYWEDHDWLPR